MELSANPVATLPLEPGLWRADPYLERYTVPPCGSVVFELLAGDQITVTDPEGGQPGELIAFSPDGRCAPASLCDTAPQEAAGFQKILASNEPSARQVAAGLKRRGISPAEVRAIPLFDSDTHPGSAQHYTARDDILCVVCAPGSAMVVDAQVPPTSLTVHVNRKSGKTLQEPALPEPLGIPGWNFVLINAPPANIRCTRVNTSRLLMSPAGSVPIFLPSVPQVLTRAKSAI